MRKILFLLVSIPNVLLLVNVGHEKLDADNRNGTIAFSRFPSSKP